MGNSETPPKETSKTEEQISTPAPHELPEEVLGDPSMVRSAIRHAVQSLAILPEDRPANLGRRAIRRMRERERENPDTFRMGVREAKVGEGIFQRTRSQAYERSKIEPQDPSDMEIPSVETLEGYFREMKEMEERSALPDETRQWTSRDPHQEAVRFQTELQRTKDELVNLPADRHVSLRITSPMYGERQSQKHWARRIADLERAVDEDGLPMYWYHFKPSPIPFRDEIWNLRMYLKTIVDDEGKPDVRARIIEALNIATGRDRERHLAGHFDTLLAECYNLKMDLQDDPLEWRVTAWPRIFSMTPGLGRRLRINGRTVEIRAPGVKEHNIHQRPIQKYVEGNYYFSVNTPDWLDFVNLLASWVNRYPSPPVGLLELYELGTKGPISYVIVENALDELERIEGIIETLGVEFKKRPEMKDPIRLADLLAPGLPDGRPLEEAEYPHFAR
jgi:hypothetical protein